MPAPYARRDAFQSLARAVNRTAPGQAQGRFRGLRSTSSGVAGSTHTDPSISTVVDFSHIQGWSITDDATDTFTLDYLPVENSWNLSLNGLRVHRSEFGITDQTLTITSPADLFLGADTQGTPWDLEIQYDATVKGADASIVGNVGYAGAFNASFELPSGVLPGDLMLITNKQGGASGIVLETGFFNIYSDAEPNAHYRMQGKFIDTEIPGDIITLHGGSDFVCMAVMTIVRGIHLASPIVDFASPTTPGEASSVTTSGVNVIVHHAVAVDVGPLTIDRGVQLIQGDAGGGGHTGYYVSSAESTNGTVSPVAAPPSAGMFQTAVALRPA